MSLRRQATIKYQYPQRFVILFEFYFQVQDNKFDWWFLSFWLNVMKV